MFWSLVSGLIATHSGVRIVAYCEGKQCLASLDRMRQEVPFTVIGYAGMIDAQAILNADARGEFVIKDLAEFGSSSRVKWRETGQTPVSRTIALLLGIAMTADAYLILTVPAARARNHAPLGPQAVLRGDPERLAPPEAFSESGALLAIKPAAGWAIRYASNSCPLSAQDSEWPRLATQLSKHGIPIMVILPEPANAYAADEIIPKGASQAAFVSLDWVKHVRLTLTPTVILFGATGETIWYRLGILSTADVEAAVQAIMEDASRAR
jgi:hypothetical protein